MGASGQSHASWRILLADLSFVSKSTYIAVWLEDTNHIALFRLRRPHSSMLTVDVLLDVRFISP
jgi:hypothetical protein